MRIPPRRGFTLTELLVVITILLLLTVFIVAVFRGDSADKVRSAGRTAQSAILGARDRALHAKAKRGFRLIRDPNDSTLCTGFAYLQPIDNLQYAMNSIQLERPDNDNNFVPDSSDVVIVNGFADLPPTPPADPVADWYQVKDFFSNPPRIRIPAGTGQWYPFFWSTSGKYQLTATQPYLQLTRPFIDPGATGVVVAFPRSNGTYTSCEIEMAPELLPQHQPIALPSGVVIDLDYSSPNINANWPGTTFIDIMYSARGMVHGPLAALGPIHFALRDIRDATEGNNPGWLGADVPGTPAQIAGKYETLILTIFPQTGHVATFPVDLTDNDGDNNADNLFHFAQIGSVAGN